MTKDEKKRYISDIKELAGKTIKRVGGHHTSELGFLFEDDTFTYFQLIDVHYYSSLDGDFEIISKDQLTDWHILKLGLISQEEFDRRRIDRNRNHIKEMEKKERQMYEELKKKYGN